MAEHRTADTGEALTLEQRRAFMALPIEERRRQMAEQADRMLKYYEGENETDEFQLYAVRLRSTET